MVWYDPDPSPNISLSLTLTLTLTVTLILTLTLTPYQPKRFEDCCPFVHVRHAFVAQDERFLVPTRRMLLELELEQTHTHTHRPCTHCSFYVDNQPPHHHQTQTYIHTYIHTYTHIQHTYTHRPCPLYALQLFGHLSDFIDWSTHDLHQKGRGYIIAYTHTYT